MLIKTFRKTSTTPVGGFRSAAPFTKIKGVGNISREACRKTVESRFSQDKMVKEYIEVYKEILTLTS